MNGLLASLAIAAVGAGAIKTVAVTKSAWRGVRFGEDKQASRAELHDVFAQTVEDYAKMPVKVSRTDYGRQIAVSAEVSNDGVRMRNAVRLPASAIDTVEAALASGIDTANKLNTWEMIALV